MSRVLVIDDDRGTLDSVAAVLRVAGFAVSTADSGREGLARAQDQQPDVVLCDLRLPDLSGVDVLREFQQTHTGVPFVIVTGWGTIPSAVEAIQLGACNYVEKPLIGGDLVDVVVAALARRIMDDAARPEAYAAARWARAIVPVVKSKTDPTTLEAWARCAVVSPGTLKNWCRTANVTPRCSLRLARLLRAVVRHHVDGYQPHQSLDIVDARTLAKFLRFSGVEPGASSNLPGSVREFLSRQTLIRDPITLRELERALNSSELDRS